MIIGIDLGGTSIKAGLVDKGKIVRKISRPTEADKGMQRVIRNILDCAHDLYTTNVTGIGLGSPGFIDHKKGTVTFSPNLPINNINFVGVIGHELNLPVKLENDANCFAFGEAIYGAAKGKKNVVGITMGTGIGSGVVIDGKIYYGRDRAGELGHTTIVYDGESCSCSMKGHLESYIGTKGIQKRFGKQISPEDIFKLAQKGDKKAIKTWEETGKYLGVGITNFIHSYDPDIIVVGGNVAKAWKFFNLAMFHEIGKESLFRKTQVVQAKLDEPGIIGAASLFD